MGYSEPETVIKYAIACLPRSRSYWLSKTLSYKDQICLHDPLGRVDNLLDLPNANGMADTGVGLFFKPFSRLYQDLNWIVIERPLKDVKLSLARIGLPTWGMDALASSLKKVKERAKLIVPYYQLDNYAEQIWEAAQIPYEFDREWWDSMKKQNLQNVVIPERPTALLEELFKWHG